MDSSYRLIVKFKPEEIARVKDGELFFANQQKIMTTANAVLNFKYTLVIPELAATGELVCTENSIDFSKYKGLVYVNDTTSLDKETLEHMVTMFNGLDIVEYAELEPVIPPPPPGVVTPLEDGDVSISVASTTPDFSQHQGYLGGQMRANPAIWGINARFAWSSGARGQGVRCADIEWGFIFNHEDLADPNFIELLPTTDHSNDNHGAAVTGMLFARHNGFGMQGATPDLDILYGISEIPFGRLNAITFATRRLSAGDVLIYEMQTGGRNDNLVPCDFQRGVWDLTQQATRAGIIVVAAAGNGGENLDHPFYDEYRNRGDNGIIIVGGGSNAGRNRNSDSTFGSPVHVQGWGNFTVASTGYGDLFNEGRTRTYTNRFSGTSSGTAMVAAAVIAIQSWYKPRHNNVPLSPRAMRDLLRQTGIPQGTAVNGHIGPLPEIANAITAIRTGTFVPS